MDYVLMLLLAGWETLQEYLSAHVLTCLVPALFIAGAIQVFLSKEAVLKYLGPKANKAVAYGVASVSGTVLAVCSCTVLPMFAGIYKRGAGIGPATAFLYAGPAINILAIVYTARLLGYDIGLARAIGAVAFSAVIGLIMAAIFGRREQPGAGFAAVEDDGTGGIKDIVKRAAMFAALGGLLVFAAAKNWPLAALFLAATVVIPIALLKKEDNLRWLRETWRFTLQIGPWLVVGVFAAGIIKVLLPHDWVAAAVGTNTIWSNLLAAAFGAVMYFATLTEVPILRAFMDMGMAKGPVLTMLLADPALSLPGILALRAIMGTVRTLAFVGIVVVVSSVIGLIYGYL